MVVIELRGRSYPALFDLQNVKELQEHYSDLTVLPEKLNNIEEAAYILWLLIREGIELDNEEHHKDTEAPSLNTIRRLITYGDLTDGKVVEAVETAFMEFYGKNGSGRQVLEATRTMLKESGLMTSPNGTLTAKKNKSTSRG
nr:MAG TPA: hypothetical protein [Caudoviricetes sp.]